MIKRGYLAFKNSGLCEARSHGIMETLNIFADRRQVL